MTRDELDAEILAAVHHGTRAAVGLVAAVRDSEAREALRWLAALGAWSARLAWLTARAAVTS